MAEDEADLELARTLAREAMALCNRLGRDIAAAHLQLVLDLLDDRPRPFRLRDRRSPWPESE